MNGEDQARSLPACPTAAPPQTAARQETSQPLPSACPPPTNNHVDEIDEDTLIDQYDVGGGIGREIFGALDTGGLEDVGEDEEEELDLTDKGMCSFVVRALPTFKNSCTFCQMSISSTKHKFASQLHNDGNQIVVLAVERLRSP